MLWTLSVCGVVMQWLLLRWAVSACARCAGGLCVCARGSCVRAQRTVRRQPRFGRAGRSVLTRCVFVRCLRATVPVLGRVHLPCRLPLVCECTDWTPEPAEKGYYDKLFAVADKGNAQAVAGAEVAGILTMSGLPKPMLSQVRGRARFAPCCALATVPGT